MFYGANFVDYVGYVDNKLTMVRPANGVGYDSFIYDQYFDLTIDGANGADDVTLAAINAIKAIPERVSYEDRAFVEAARAAYTKIATIEQQALVTNYADLISAEQRITALTPGAEGEEGADPSEATEPVEEPTENSGIGAGVAILAAVVAAGGAVGYAVTKKRKTTASESEQNAEELPTEEAESEAPAEEEEEEIIEASEPETEE